MVGSRQAPSRSVIGSANIQWTSLLQVVVVVPSCNMENGDKRKSKKRKTNHTRNMSVDVNRCIPVDVWLGGYILWKAVADSRNAQSSRIAKEKKVKKKEDLTRQL